MKAVPLTWEALQTQRLELLPLLGWNGLPCDSLLQSHRPLHPQPNIEWRPRDASRGPPQPTCSLSHQLALRKPTHARQSGFRGMGLPGRGQCHFDWPMLSERLERPLGPPDQISSLPASCRSSEVAVVPSRKAEVRARTEKSRGQPWEARRRAGENGWK